jgi:hypothetical protein
MIMMVFFKVFQELAANTNENELYLKVGKLKTFSTGSSVIIGESRELDCLCGLNNTRKLNPSPEAY